MKFSNSRFGPENGLERHNNRRTVVSSPPFPRVLSTPDRTKSAFSNLLVQYISLGILMTQGILLVPLYLKHIDPIVFGIWLSTGQALSWVALLDPGISDLLRQKTAFAHGRNDTHLLGEVIGSGLAIGLFFSLVSTATGIVLVELIPKLFNSPPRYVETLKFSCLLAVLSIGISLLSYPFCAVLQGLQKNLQFGAVQIIGSVSGLLLSIIMLNSGYGLTSLPAGLLLRSVIWLIGFGLLVANICHRLTQVTVGVSTKQARGIFMLSGFTFISRTVQSLSFSSDAVMAGIFLGSVPTMTLVLTSRASELVRMVAERVSTASLSGLSHLAGQGDQGAVSRAQRQLLYLTLTLAGGGAGLVLATNKKFMSLWVGTTHYGGTELTLYLALAMAVYVLSGAINQLLFSVGSIKTSALLTIVAGTGKVVVAYLLVHSLGILAFPISTILCCILTIVIYLVRQAPTCSVSTVAVSDVFSFCLKSSGFCVMGLCVDRVFRNISWATLAGSAGLYCVGAAALTYLSDPVTTRQVISIGARLLFRERAFSPQIISKEPVGSTPLS